MNQTEWDSFVMDVFERCYPSTMDWLASRDDRGAAVLSQWFVELQEFEAHDVMAAIESIHRRNDGPEAYDRECWPAFIRRHIGTQREAERSRTDWKGSSRGVCAAVTEGDGNTAEAFRASCTARTEARNGLPADAEPWLEEATVQVATYKAIGDVLDPNRTSRVPEWGEY